MTQWYYVDRTHTRQGPVTAGALAMAYGQGQLDETGLVWREGLAEWAPLGQFREELGLPPSSSVAAPPPAPPAPAPASIKRGTGCLIAAAVAGVVGLFLVAILAAIALPAYQQYVTRAKVATAVAQARALQVSVDEFVANVDRCPRDADEVQMALPNPPGVAAITLGEANTGMCYIELELSAGAGFAELAGQRIRLSRDRDGGWYCTSDTPQTQVLPATCR